MPRRGSSSSIPYLSPPLLIILLPIVTLIVLFLAIPSFLSVTSHLLRPITSVKRSRDSFNIFLVLFAILCGIFAKRNDDGSSARDDVSPISSNGTNQERQEREFVVSKQWFGVFGEQDPR
ncbi:Hydroxyproline-rich glycoprotein family protein [Quillaja saponaria]|uniref:Hydroxyproline-rich glycoprotein family protein n=1 Tax=Quillaja saponaria TaxID=32244 RepID=A0AAD7QD38_QUISA|nr:Hydroxyproline-rich glycoprotein family protein [Quillaja saponaria]